MKVILFISLSWLFIVPCLRGQQLPTSRVDTAQGTDSAEYRDDIYIEKYTARRVYLPFQLQKDSVMQDTVLSLLDLHERHTWNLYRTSVGNSFSPGYSLKLDDPIRVGPRLGYDAYILDKFEEDRDEHFQSDVAITNLYYSMASKSEQEFNGIHRHSLSSRFDFSVRLHKQNAPGFYSGEKTNTSYFGVQTYWTSKNLKWQNEYYFRRASLQYNQNGGILSDTFYTDSEYNNLRLVPTSFSDVNLQKLANGSSWLDRHTAQNFGTVLRLNFGSVSRGITEDSTTETYSLKPKSYFEWGLSQQGQRYDMYYGLPDSASLAELAFEDLRTLDTLGTNVKLHNYRAYMAYALPISTLVPRSALRVFIDYTYSDYSNGSNLSNVSLGGELNYSSQRLEGLASLRFFTAGSNAGDVDFRASLVQTSSAFSNSFRYSFVRSKAPLFYNQNQFYNLIETNGLDPETHQHLSWEFKYKWLRGGAGVHSYYNYIYAQESSMGLNSFENLNTLSNIYYAQLGAKLEGKRWGVEGNVYGQRVPVDFPLAAPSVFLTSKVYIHGAWFKGRLDYYTGIQFSMSNDYRASVYDLFYNNWAQSEGITPYVRNYDASYFINIKVSRAKLFLRFSQLNQLIASNYSIGIARNYSGEQDYNYIGSPNFNIRFGVSWFMIN